jgi:hypothetical protein
LQGEEDEAFEFLHCQDTIDSIEIISLTDFLKEEEGFRPGFLEGAISDGFLVEVPAACSSIVLGTCDGASKVRPIFPECIQKRNANTPFE